MAKPKIVITGGSKGIGLAIAKRFATAGWDVLICARKKKGLDAAAKAVPRLKTYVCDISSKEEIQAFGKYILKEFGLPDVLINNGGIFLPGSIGDEKNGIFEELMAVNVASAYHLTRMLLPKFKNRKKGTIVNLCSVASMKAYPNGGSYCISKFALLGFSKVLREELKPYNIRVVSVMPGAVFTASWEGSGIDEQRMMPAEDIAEIIFCSVGLSQRTVVEEIVLRPMEGDF